MKKYFLAVLIIFLMTQITEAQTLGDIKCNAYSNIFKNTLNYRRQNVSIEIPISMAESHDNWYLITKIIRAIYENPDEMEKMIENGELHKLCASYINGF